MSGYNNTTNAIRVEATLVIFSDLQPTPRKGNFHYFVLWDYRLWINKNAGRYFECDIEKSAAKSSYKTTAWDGDIKYLRSSRIFKLGIKPKTGDR